MASHSSLVNNILIAMPSISDPIFEHSVIYVCEHHVQGSVGLIINRPMEWKLGLVFEQLNIDSIHVEQKQKPVLFGGPVQQERGFVIHREKGDWESSLLLRDGVTITTSNDIIRAVASDTGPQNILVTLGYAGWEEGQLEKELMDNSWLVCPYSPELLYDIPFEKRWEAAGLSIGVDMNTLTSISGHA